MAKQGKSKKSKQKERKVVSSGLVHINATFNNTIISVSDLNGNVIAWSSTGSQGFKGSKKNTPFAAKIVGEEVMKKTADFGLRSCDILIKGPGNGRESALRSISSSGVKINSIRDVTPIPHNGCKPPKKRRI